MVGQQKCKNEQKWVKQDKSKEKYVDEKKGQRGLKVMRSKGERSAKVGQKQCASTAILEQTLFRVL